MRKFIEALTENDYQGEHQPADPEGGCPLYDLTHNGVYPRDVYGPNGYEYSLGMTTAFSLALSYKGRPNRVVTIYRAVPKDIPRAKINPGDWVGTTRAYAKEHGESHLNGPYKIISKTVYARDLFTDGNSIEEWGYVPQPPVARAQEDQIRLSLGMKTVADARADHAARVAARKGVSEAVVAEDMQQPKLPPAFWTWFGDSKVVDSRGQPLVVYHGTGADIGNFKTKTIWASVKPDLANEYAFYSGEWREGNSNVIPMYMRIVRPFDADMGLSKDVTVGDFTGAIIEQGTFHVDLTNDMRERASDLIDIIHRGRWEEESGPHYDRHDFWLSPGSMFGMKGAEALRDLFSLFGFDGIKMIEDGQLTFGAFSPNQVKSVFNQGGYRPDSPHISEGLTEAFDAVPIHWEDKRLGYRRATFVVNDITYTVAFNDMHNGWEVLFVSPDADGWATTHNTGLGGHNAPKVFGGVLQAIEEFLKETRPDRLTFSGDKGQGKGTLYAKMARMLAHRLHALGYDVRESGDDDRYRNFTIFQKEPVMEGAEDDLAALDIAKQASSAFAKWLISRNEETQLKEVMRLTKYGSEYVYAIPATELGLEYDDLMICVGEMTGDSRGRLHMYHMKGSKTTYYALTLYVSLPNIGDQVDVGFSLNWSTFVHEFVHYLDHKRGYTSAVIKRKDKAYRAHVDRLIAGKEPLPAKPKFSSANEYYNDPIELNGHFQQGLSDIVEMLARSLEKHPDHGFTWTFPQFRQMALIHMPKSFHLALRKHNSRSLDRRLYKIWQHMQDNWPNISLLKRLIER